MSIPSPFRVPAAEVGKAKNQDPAYALANFGCRAYWPFGGAAKPDGRMGFAYETSSFTVWYTAKANGKTIRVFRNPANQDSPAYWSTMEEFKALPKTIPQYNWFPPIQWYNNLLASKQDALLDTKRYVNLPWGVNWRTPTGTTDNGTLIDDPSGVTGYETLGLRVATPADRLAINFRAGQEVIYDGDWIFDGCARRTGANIGKYVGRGMGDIPKRAGILMMQDMIDGWDEAKALALPNVQFGPNATFQAPATRVEHTAAKQRVSYLPNDIYPFGPDVRMVPHGTRFVLNMSKAKFDAWADNQGYKGALRTAAQKNWEGMSTFGLIVSETCTNDGIGESEGVVNGETKEKANSIGITSASIANRMWNGLFVPGNFYVANPTPFQLR